MSFGHVQEKSSSRECDKAMFGYCLPEEEVYRKQILNEK